MVDRALAPIRVNAVLLSNDLMFTSRVSGAAQASGARLTSTPTLAGLLERLDAQPAQLVILDLSTPGLDIAAVAAAVRGKDSAAKIVAFGPHVHEQRLAAARAAGCDEVLTRGQFNSGLDALLARHLGAG